VTSTCKILPRDAVKILFIIYSRKLTHMSRVTQYSIWIRAGRPGYRSSIPDIGERTFFLASVFGQAQGPTQPPVHWVPGVLSPGLKRGRGVTLTTHLHLVPRSRMSRSYTSSPSSSFMACSGTLLALNLHLPRIFP
jgi:hypothetical protein